MNINSLVLRSIGFEPMTFRLGRDSSIRAELRARIMPIIYNNRMDFNRYWRCNLARGDFPYSPHPRPLSPANFVRTARGLKTQPFAFLPFSLRTFLESSFVSPLIPFP
jgi:hypothetical protein